MLKMVNWLVPDPVPPPELPVLKKLLSDKVSPIGLCPDALQKIVLPDGDAGVGVQVRTVLPTPHELDVERKVSGDGSKNWTLVMLVSIASLKVNTTGAEGETPVAA